ncbi:hypothetical protein CALCODRAFT_503192 [Calocera cornea HHB12733]|uniref:TLC domain-containing protein n=1 Tax=Calocera cornea HHB12733 TaxID=1353952 RepID=A0A165CZA5_9BASI|nr:hypothetical protein CALCODRAFT_503192 [Calocera cornea HHB12733]
MSSVIDPLLSSPSAALWPFLPPHLVRTFALAYLSNVLVFFSGCKRYQKPVQRMWFLSVYASGAMTVCALPFFVDWLSNGCSMAAIKPRTALAETACVSFMAHLFADLSLGLIFYRDHLPLGWKWIHHSIFICLLSYTLSHGLSHFFTLGGMMELPIYVLFLGFLEPQLKSDYLNIGVLVTFRIVFNAILAAQFWLPSVQMLWVHTAPWWVCGALNTAIIPGHIWIMHRIVGRFLRERGEKRTARLAE